MWKGDYQIPQNFFHLRITIYFPFNVPLIHESSLYIMCSKLPEYIPVHICCIVLDKTSGIMDADEKHYAGNHLITATVVSADSQ